MALLKRAAQGVREMPSNAAWLVDRVAGSTDSVGEATGSVTSRARDQARRLGEAVATATPGGGDSITVRLKRAQDAADRARDAEERAAEAAQDAKDRANHALHVSERARARVDEVDREAARDELRRIRKAEKQAEELVRRERAAAKDDAERRRREARAEVASELLDTA